MGDCKSRPGYARRSSLRRLTQSSASHCGPVKGGSERGKSNVQHIVFDCVEDEELDLTPSQTHQGGSAALAADLLGSILRSEVRIGRIPF